MQKAVHQNVVTHVFISDVMSKSFWCFIADEKLKNLKRTKDNLLENSEIPHSAFLLLYMLS